MICPVHGCEQRTIGMLTICEQCKAGAPALPPSNGAPVMTISEALWVLHDQPNQTPAYKAAYGVVALALMKGSL